MPFIQRKKVLQARPKVLAPPEVESPQPAAQINLFQRWWNDWLAQRGLVVTDLSAAAKAGEIPIALCEIVTGKTAHVEHMGGDQGRTNNLAAMALLRSAKVQLISANGSTRSLTVLPHAMDDYALMASRLTRGSWNAVSSLTWSLIIHIDVRITASMTTIEALSELLSWVHERTAGYALTLPLGHTRYAWSSAFADGRVWAALISAHDASLCSYEDLADEDVTTEVRLAAVMTLAQEQLGVPQITSPADVMTQDPRVAITFTAALRNAIQAVEDANAVAASTADAATVDSGSVPSECRAMVHMSLLKRNSVTFTLPGSPTAGLSPHSKVFELRRRRRKPRKSVKSATGDSPSRQAVRSHLGRESSLDRFGMMV